TSGTVTAPPAPKTTVITPASAKIGAIVTVKGSNFSPTAVNNLVTFTGPENRRIIAPVVGATATVLQVQVPPSAADGPVKVAVNGVQQTGTVINFVVTNPRISAVTVGSPAAPASAKLGQSATVQISGTKFQSGAAVSIGPSDDFDVNVLSV